MLPETDVSKTKQKAAFSRVCARIIKNFFPELPEPMQKNSGARKKWISCIS
jgi:hypothetical protein